MLPRGYSHKRLKKIIYKIKHREQLLPRGFSQTCDGIQCQLCKLVEVTDTAWDSWGRPHRISTSQCCSTANGIYRIHCAACKKAYIGETGGPFKVRMAHHKNAIKYSKGPIGKHFKEGTCTPADMRLTFLEHFDRLDGAGLDFDPNKAKRLALERKWQVALNTGKPFGLNTLSNPQDTRVTPILIPYSDSAIKMTKLCRQTYQRLMCWRPQVFYQKIVAAYKRNPNLKDLLTRSRLHKLAQDDMTQSTSSTSNGDSFESSLPSTIGYSYSPNNNPASLSETLTIPFTLSLEEVDRLSSEDIEQID